MKAITFKASSPRKGPKGKHKEAQLTGYIHVMFCSFQYKDICFSRELDFYVSPFAS